MKIKVSRISTGLNANGQLAYRVSKEDAAKLAKDGVTLFGPAKDVCYGQINTALGADVEVDAETRQGRDGRTYLQISNEEDRRLASQYVELGLRKAMAARNGLTTEDLHHFGANM